MRKVHLINLAVRQLFRPVFACVLVVAAVEIDVLAVVEAFCQLLFSVAAIGAESLGVNNIARATASRTSVFHYYLQQMPTSHVFIRSGILSIEAAFI